VVVYSSAQYWQRLAALHDEHPDLPSKRVCRLLDRAMKSWRNPPRWPHPSHLPHLFEVYPDARQLSVAVRRGMAIRQTLKLLVSPPLAGRLGMLEIHPDELIVGRMPPYSVGQGKELVGHLSGDERLEAWFEYLDDRSAFGHVVPDHSRLLAYGIEGLMERVDQSARRSSGKSSEFYRSVLEALQGVLEFADAYADAAERLASATGDSASRESLSSIAERVRRTPRSAPKSFHDAVQCLFLTHCALHSSGETVSVGRLDQLLGPFYERDIASGMLHPRAAQEIIDCLWIKFDERAMLHREQLQDRFTFADGALLGNKQASNFDQGCLLNQWMQQVTIGGFKANDEAVAEDGVNEVTFLCLEASRRLPLNSPTLDLRLHANIPDAYRERLFRSAARTLLSGGAHPVLMNDDKIVPALHEKTGAVVPWHSARNYACDGCYETLFAGETEFSFGYVPALAILERALNRGAGLGLAGPTHLRGFKESYRTSSAEEIESYDEFWKIFLQHLELACHRYLHGVLKYYGEKRTVCPSPLLSALINGCVETGRDLTAGGARYRLFSPLMTGISTCADSLYVIRHLVFPLHHKPRALTLEELVACLRANWDPGHQVPGVHIDGGKITELHALCSSQPKFGTGHADVDQFAWDLITAFCDAMQRVQTHPVHQAAWQRLKEQYSTAGEPFEILFAPGVGTFEQYAFGGSFVGATPDGRRSRDSIASDLSPSPLFEHEAPLDENDRHRREIELSDALRSYNHASVNRLCDGAPPDFNLSDDFPEDELVDAIREFAYGAGSNIMTFTVASPLAMRAAQANPQDYDLLRVRMGGWTEFFIVLFPQHQSQHCRRPLIVCSKPSRP
jgi:pyruvate-formate lyase